MIERTHTSQEEKPVSQKRWFRFAIALAAVFGFPSIIAKAQEGTPATQPQKDQSGQITPGTNFSPDGNEPLVQPFDQEAADYPNLIEYAKKMAEKGFSYQVQALPEDQNDARAAFLLTYTRDIKPGSQPSMNDTIDNYTIKVVLSRYDDVLPQTFTFKSRYNYMRYDTFSSVVTTIAGDQYLNKIELFDYLSKSGLPFFAQKLSLVAEEDSNFSIEKLAMGKRAKKIANLAEYLDKIPSQEKAYRLLTLFDKVDKDAFSGPYDLEITENNGFTLATVQYISKDRDADYYYADIYVTFDITSEDVFFSQVVVDFPSLQNSELAKNALSSYEKFRKFRYTNHNGKLLVHAQKRSGEWVLVGYDFAKAAFPPGSDLAEHFMNK